jgi:hypothetical protein
MNYFIKQDLIFVLINNELKKGRIHKVLFKDVYKSKDVWFYEIFLFDSEEIKIFIESDLRSCSYQSNENSYQDSKLINKIKSHINENTNNLVFFF